MTRFTPIDLAAYPVSDILETLDFESYYARDKADFLARWNARRIADPSLPAIDALALETDPGGIVLQTGSYRELLVRTRINEAARQLTLAAATGRHLDHIGATYYRAPRLAGEGDETYRRRLSIAPEAWSSAGPIGAYLFYALSASPDVLDAGIYSEDEGVCLAPEVRVVVLPTSRGVAPLTLLDDVKDELRRSDRRPLGDLVTVEAATPLPFDVEVTIKVGGGASSEIVRQKALTRITAYAEGRRRWVGDDVDGPVFLVGRTLREDTIAAAAYVEGVEEVIVTSPAADVNAVDAGDPTAHLFKAPIVGTITVTAESA